MLIKSCQIQINININRNIFIKDNVMKIGDLGMAKINETKKSLLLTSILKGTDNYLSPEIVADYDQSSDEISYSNGSDVW